MRSEMKRKERHEERGTRTWKKRKKDMQREEDTAGHRPVGAHGGVV